MINLNFLSFCFPFCESLYVLDWLPCKEVFHIQQAKYCEGEIHKSIKRRINPNWQYLSRLYEISVNDLNTMAFSSLHAKGIVWKTCTQFVFTVYKRLMCPDACECCGKAGQSCAPEGSPYMGKTKCSHGPKWTFSLCWCASRWRAQLRVCCKPTVCFVRAPVISQRRVLASWAKHDVRVIIWNSHLSFSECWDNSSTCFYMKCAVALVNE